MKKLLLLFVFFSVNQLIVNAQVVNSSFEDWNSINYSDPGQWQCGNQQSIGHSGVSPVTQVNGYVGSAVRMETIVTGSDTAQAYIANGDPMSGSGGVPCAQQPTAITGYYRYNIPGNDSAIIL